MTTVYVYLPGESVDAWRPVEATAESDSIYRLADAPTPEGETWEFQPGSRVACEWRELYNGPALVAVALV